MYRATKIKIKEPVVCSVFTDTKEPKEQSRVVILQFQKFNVKSLCTTFSKSSFFDVLSSASAVLSRPAMLVNKS